jgi:carbamoyltransferase
MSAILGISAFYHDSAAALVVDGRIVAAAQEERFTRIKHDHEFPTHAIDYCLAEAGLTPEQIDYVGFYDKPLLKFERLLETYLAYAPQGFRSFCEAMPLWLKQKLYLPREIRKGLHGRFSKRVVFTEHHESHAASAFFPSPFEEAAIVTLDGVGEWATASYGTGRGNKIELTHELRFPHSLGLLYSAFTYYTGFRVNSGEYKLMGLAPYGEPKYVDVIYQKLLDLKQDGSFRMDMSYFNYCQGLTMTGEKFHQLFGGPPRAPESPVTQREMDIAASIQVVTEEVMLRIARHVHQASGGMKNLCLAGGVALNCVGNGRILRDGPCENIWIQPAAGDAGGALGVALFIWHQLLGNPRTPQASDSQQGSLLGPKYDEDRIRAFLDKTGAKYQHYESEEQLCDAVVDLMSQDKVIGWVQGRMEFGPRALGGRSILGDARSTKMQSVMNLKIKFRESFRPFAPSVLQERVQDYFQTRPNEPSPYMLLVAPVLESRRTQLNGDYAQLQGIAKLNVPRSEVPAITHVDYSARVQTVSADRNGRYYKLIKRFDEKTGCPVIINTSFNVRGEPIVNTPEHAYRCFLSTNMDVLVLERFVLLKEDQPKIDPKDVEKYLAQFKLD